MTTWIGIAVALGLIVTLPDVAIAATSKAPAATTDAGTRRHARHHDAVRHAPDGPRYYARPVYYRPYPYGVPAPFVFGYGPFW